MCRAGWLREARRRMLMRALPGAWRVYFMSGFCAPAFHPPPKHQGQILRLHDQRGVSPTRWEGWASHRFGQFGESSTVKLGCIAELSITARRSLKSRRPWWGCSENWRTPASRGDSAKWISGRRRHRSSPAFIGIQGPAHPCARTWRHLLPVGHRRDSPARATAQQ